MMSKLGNAMGSDNASILVGIIGIVVLVSIDILTRRRYRLDATKNSISLAPAGETDNE